jgi:hypothetical protein
MDGNEKELRILDCKASEHEYLHRDFHGALCYTIKYLDDNFGANATEEYLAQVGKAVFAELSQRLRDHGLSALEDHWRETFTLEGGKFHLERDGGVLVLTVDECPAIRHLKKTGQFFTDRYCQTTVVVNDTICRQAGYAASCEYEPGLGKCVQRFWKAKD